MISRSSDKKIKYKEHEETLQLIKLWYSVKSNIKEKNKLSKDSQ